MSEVKVPVIHYYRLYTIQNDCIAEGSDFFIGHEGYSQTLDLVLDKIRQHNGKYSHFEIYKISLRCVDLRNGQVIK